MHAGHGQVSFDPQKVLMDVLRRMESDILAACQRTDLLLKLLAVSSPKDTSCSTPATIPHAVIPDISRRDRSFAT